MDDEHERWRKRLRSAAAEYKSAERELAEKRRDLYRKIQVANLVLSRDEIAGATGFSRQRVSQIIHNGTPDMEQRQK